MSECCMTRAECEHQRLVCERDRLESQQSEEKRLSKIEAALERIEGKLDGLVSVDDRVTELENWKLKLNGKAEALVEFEKNHPHPVEVKTTDPPHRAEEEGDHRPERISSEVVIQMNAKTLKLLLVAIAVSLFVLLGLALVAGERGWVVINKAKNTIEQHDQKVDNKVQTLEQNIELLRHMHEQHGAPDPDAKP